jgi:hypothetical protein
MTQLGIVAVTMPDVDDASHHCEYDSASGGRPGSPIITVRPAGPLARTIR